MLPRWLIYFRALALASAFAAAFVPIATYITDDKRDWLWIHIGINIAAYIAVALTTIYTTVNLTQQDHNKFSVPAYWANNVIMRTWYLGVSKTWRWHVAAAVGRLGLALALAQHVHIINQSIDDFQGILAPFYYASHGDRNYPLTWMVHSPWQTVVIAIAVLIGFAWLETAFLSALATMSRQAWQKINFVVGLAVFGRFAIALILVGIMTATHASTQSIKGNFFKQSHYNTTVVLNSLERRRSAQQVVYQETFKHWHKLAFTWLDNGTMLAAWMTRPVSVGSNNCLETAGEFSSGDMQCIEYEVRGDLILNVSDGIGAYMTYALVIIASLQLAQYLHWRREQRESPTPAPTTP